MERKPIEPGKIVMREFRLVKGQIDSPYEFKVSNIQKFDYDVAYSPAINLNESLIKADFAINISSQSEGNQVEATGSYHFTFVFFYEHLKDHAVLLPGAGFDWNPTLANAIASITYSTSRGILLSRFQGTAMSSFILPVVDPNALMQPATGTTKRTAHLAAPEKNVAEQSFPTSSSQNPQ